MQGSPMVAVCFLAFLLALTAAVPVIEDRSVRLPRQVVANCINQTDCLPSGVTNVPVGLISCSAGVCSCSDCFTRNDSTGRCGATVASPANCYYYNESIRECVDNRKSQVIAFALSLTLSGFGVANFYIGQNGLGAGQLVLFLSIFVIIYCVVCTPICIACCVQAENVKGSLLFICFAFLMALLLIAISFSITGWWIADAVIFGTNQRDAGDGCPLRPDL